MSPTVRNRPAPNILSRLSCTANLGLTFHMVTIFFKIQQKAMVGKRKRLVGERVMSPTGSPTPNILQTFLYGISGINCCCLPSNSRKCTWTLDSRKFGPQLIHAIHVRKNTFYNREKNLMNVNRY